MRLQDGDLDRLGCAHSGEIVGVYEPMRLLLADGRDRRGSPLTPGDQLEAPGSTAVHEARYDSFAQQRAGGRAEAGG
jgi:hypothetical protein